jgi:hypothetical protein
MGEKPKAQNDDLFVLVTRVSIMRLRRLHQIDVYRELLSTILFRGKNEHRISSELLNTLLVLSANVYWFNALQTVFVS